VVAPPRWPWLPHPGGRGCPTQVAVVAPPRWPWLPHPGGRGCPTQVAVVAPPRWPWLPHPGGRGCPTRVAVVAPPGWPWLPHPGWGVGTGALPLRFYHNLFRIAILPITYYLLPHALQNPSHNDLSLQ